MKELFDFILVRLYYRLFVRPRSAAQAAPEWDIDPSCMKATYRGPAQTRDHFAGMSMTFYLAEDGKGGKTLCGGLDLIPAAAQTAFDAMSIGRRKRLLRRLIEEGDKVFRAAWDQKINSK